MSGNEERTYTLDELVVLINKEISALGDVSVMVWPSVYDIYRDVLIEHRTIPELPIAYILYRHLLKAISQNEIDWWVAHGGKHLTPEEANPSLSKILFSVAGKQAKQ